jgi:uncharacterized protein (TIGR02328 family)
MRIWHKELIEVLPKQQLVAQWREILAIKGAIEKKGTPNHVLVNKVMDYDFLHLFKFACEVCEEFKKRGYKYSVVKFNDLYEFCRERSYKFIFPNKIEYAKTIIEENNLYNGWHNDIYLRQCLYNLEEKYICGGISQEEWDKIYNKFKDRFELVEVR